MRRKIASHLWLLCALTLGGGLLLAGLYWQLLDNRYSQAGRERAEQALRELGWLMSDITAADSAEQSILLHRAGAILRRFSCGSGCREGAIGSRPIVPQQ